MSKDGPWLPAYLTNAELAGVELPAEAALLAETFDATWWGRDGGRAAAERLLDRCRSGGAVPESLTLARTCLHVQSRLVRVLTQDHAEAEEQALLERLADAVRRKVAAGAIDDEVAVIAEHISRPEQPIPARVYEDPVSRPPRSLLWGLMLQPASALQHPLENQLSEVLAFLIDRGANFAGGFLRLCDGDQDGGLRVAVQRAGSIGARTRISLPAPAPEGLPKRATLFPDISIEGSDRTFQIFVEVKVDGEPHLTTTAGSELLQPDAYAAAWRQIHDVEAAKVRRVCTLTRAVTDVLDPSDGRADAWRRAAVTWMQVGELIDRLLKEDAEPQLSLILGELRSIIDNVVYHVDIDPEEWELVQRTGRTVLDAIVEELTSTHPDVQPSSAVTARADYVGRYVTVPVDGRSLRLWLYAVPEGGRYNLVNQHASIIIAIADQTAEWKGQPHDLAAAAQQLDLPVQRDNAGYHMPRRAHALTLGLEREPAVTYGREIGAKLAAAF